LLAWIILILLFAKILENYSQYYISISLWGAYVIFDSVESGIITMSEKRVNNVLYSNFNKFKHVVIYGKRY